ncbi:hypothetical protein M408DRAFT_325940 [Serendipita vermifera MAFF 305830]|uniref:Uncharacterized protein n=1 Tax=Serendipita vermifera MAFF 305830 TaxID=933852 RepID=A0A0C3BNW8_SERVB|nr:hypothetical protein M408DRAFT_325940 [Serendipita vermifera MAFF 305830]
MSSELQPNNPRQGVKRDAQGQPKSQNTADGELSVEVRRILDNISTSKLVSIFEPAFREHVKLRAPTANVDQVIENLKKDTNREKIYQLASLSPLVIAQLKEQNRYQPFQSQDSEMEVDTHTSPPPPDDINPIVNIPTLSDFAPSTNLQEPRPLAPSRNTTVVDVFYTAGRGKNKTFEHAFDVSEVDYVRALAWSRRFYRFDQSNEHLAYHFKVVLSSDVQQLFASLAALDIVGPTKLPLSDGNDSNEIQEAFKRAQAQYNLIVAQSLYELPTAWPSNADYLVDLNHDKSRELCPSSEDDPYLDITDIIQKGSNTFTLVEFKDAQKYTFCLFQKSPSPEEIEMAAGTAAAA